MQHNAAKPTDEPWLLVEQPALQVQPNEEETVKPYSTHITLQPPNDSRKRAIERFGFTKVFHEEAAQLEVFEEIGAMENIQNVLKNGRDGLIATLGVTGSGKVSGAAILRRILLTQTESYHPRHSLSSRSDTNVP